MFLFVGLGNPGAEYARHRHNIGFMAMEAIADKHGFSNWKEKSKGLVSEGRLGTDKVILLKPQTFMNLSGESVQPLAAFYKIPLDDIFIFHDELDLAEAVLKVKKGGGSAGHNGLKSITGRFGSPDYYRVRMGIGHPGSKARVNGHVLGNFKDEDHDWLDPLLDLVAKRTSDLLNKPNDFVAKITQEMKEIKNV
ncbi:MAG: aminoacyl-tRNA hydrolase [Alphaproteobacteria bacterium]|nr:MAG: aminoacyl-tRNA hydrolase [Alphaproteobacteria bacterium]